MAAILFAVYYHYPKPSFGKVVQFQPKTKEQVCLLMVGDVGSGKPAQHDVATLMNTIAQKHAVDAIVFAGDNFINHGVTDIHDILWQERFHSVYSLPNIKNIPVFAILGNHDYAGNAQAQIDYTKVSAGRWNMPARHYSVSFGNIAQVACIDTNFPDRSGLGILPLDKVEQQLRTSKIPWKIVVGHRPLYSGGIYSSIQAHLKIILERFLDSCNADVYFSGHDHCQQHIPFVPFLGKREIQQIVAGCGGSDLRDIELIHKKALYTANSHGVVRVTLTSQKAEFCFHVVGASEPAYSFSLSREEKNGHTNRFRLN